MCWKLGRRIGIEGGTEAKATANEQGARIPKCARGGN